MRALCFCLLLSVPSISHAQDSKDFRKVRCRFLSLDRTAPPPPLVNLGDKGVEVPCTVYTNSLSPPSECHARGNGIHFLSSVDRKPAASATIPANCKDVILVFDTAEKSPDALPWRVFVIDDTTKNFPDGGVFVVNFLKQDVRFVIGEDPLIVHPGESHGFALPEKRDDFNMAPVIFEVLQHETWRTANESSLRFLPGTRYLIFACLEPASGRPRIRTYRDFSPFAKPPKPR